MARWLKHREAMLDPPYPLENSFEVKQFAARRVCRDVRSVERCSMWIDQTLVDREADYVVIDVLKNRGDSISEVVHGGS